MGTPSPHPKILVIGTGDTKSDELQFMASVITEADGIPVMVDVSILGDPPYVPDYSKHDIARFAGKTIEDVVESGDENSAIALMADGATALVKQLHEDRAFDGVIILGGSMGTDLALDVLAALPFGVPKFIVSTIAYSHLIPPDRIPPDLMMILWSGGLYGLNDVCRAVLSQACGAVVGAARHVTKIDRSRPMIGMTSLGSSCLKYMKYLKPELEKRGYEVAIFHATGMGGRAFERIAARNGFVAAFDFCTQELSNEYYDTVVTSGPDRLENAGQAGIPQIVAPGAIDMVDLQAWRPLPSSLAERPYHAHNRLIGSVSTSPEGRREVARVLATKLGNAGSRTAFLLPLQGVQEWDQPEEPLHDPEGLEAFISEIRASLPAHVPLHEVDSHINARQFSERALEVFDAWVAEGVIPKGQSAA
jgi:uncharacterized protein (UPF0261 family)